MAVGYFSPPSCSLFLYPPLFLSLPSVSCLCLPLLLSHPFSLSLPSIYHRALSLSLSDEFGRAVYVATGLKLTRHLVHTIFKIFDVDHDDQLSYKEFIGIMKDRLHRGGRVGTERGGGLR